MTEEQASFEIRHDHPALEGHFPGDPVVPGVVILEQVIRVHRRLQGSSGGAVSMERVRFLRVVRPGDRVVVTFSAVDAAGKQRFTCHHEGDVVVRGVLEPGWVDGGPRHP